MEQIDRLFEISFEICNKVGGIYTVVASKTKYVIEEFKDKYIGIGFYNPKLARVEFDEKEPDENIKEIFEILKLKKIIAHYGKWNIKGRPNVILLDTHGFMENLNEIKKELWSNYNIDSLYSTFEFNEIVVWSYAVGILLENLCNCYKKKGEKNFIAHFHEWLSGGGMLYLKMKRIPIKCIFTTHATVAGRTMSGAGINLYKKIEDGIKNKETLSLEFAKGLGIIDKHTMEIACAKNCDMFTTVSEITAREAEYCLGKRPDFILQNGIDIEQNIGIEELTILRRKYRIQMRNFLNAYFLRYYNVDTQNIRSLFISGRYEFRNKGIDVLIKALGKVNRELKEENKEGRKNNIIVAFLFIPADYYGENDRVMRNVMLYEDIREMIDNETPTIKNKILKNIINGKICISPEEACKDIFTQNFVNSCRDKFAHFSELRGQDPPITTHDLKNHDDLIMNALKSENLLNKKEDKVKVIYYPAYLTPGGMFIGLDYYHTILTFDLGIFPSYYEPWGYTPLETAKHGVITVTTDLSGFGKFIKERNGEKGIYVIERSKKSDAEVIDEIAKIIKEVVNFTPSERIAARIMARDLASFADWRILIKNYFDAYKML